jgi:hypothetical protein
LSIIASVCKGGTSSDHEISVFEGNNCEKIKCVGKEYGTNECGANSKSVFFAFPASTYYIYISQYIFSPSPGKFTLTIDGSSSFLSLINPITNKFIVPLGADLYYSTLPTSNLNMQATFDPIIPVTSVRMTFDNPKRNFCEKKAPYAIFGDFNGDFYNATIPVGTHLATATPYGQPGCRGPPGITVATEFTVISCGFYFHAYDTNSEWNRVLCSLGYSLQVPRSTRLSVNASALPCNVNVQFQPYCGFDIRFVQMTLRSAVTKKVVHESTTNGTGPFFLFGTRIVRSNPRFTTYAASNNSIAPGSYTLTATVNGIQQPSMSLFIDNELPCTDCSTDRCGCLGVIASKTEL